MTDPIIIRHRWSDAVLFTSTTASNLREAVLEAVAAKADLRDADLRGADLRGADLRDAVLRDADLRGAVLRGAVLRDADLRGAVLRDADLRGAVLRGAVLRGAVLRDADLRDADLRDADLRGADLRDADLRGADLRGADLRDAVLRDADLRGTVGLTLEQITGNALPVPKIPNIHRAVLAAVTADQSKFDMSQWHSLCGTKHCRAGWVCVLGGAEGKALEARIGPAAAAMRIYLENDPMMERLPKWHAGTAEALADIQRCAAEEEAKEKAGT